MSDNELGGYYVIKPENLIKLTKETNQNYYITADMLQESIVTSEIDEWEKLGHHKLMSYFVALRNVMDLLDQIINSPSKEATKLAKKHKIDGFLVEEICLQQLNAYLLVVEAHQHDLNDLQKLGGCVH